MENVNIADNPQHNSAYSFGLIMGVKLLLQKVTDLVNTEPDPAAGGHYVVALSILLNHVNEMPTVTECGKFRLAIDQPKNEIVFDWIPGKKTEMLDLLNQS